MNDPIKLKKQNIDVLKTCQLFSNLDLEELNAVCDDIGHSTTRFKKDEIIFHEGDFCDSLGIIIKGKVELVTYFISGDVSNLITMDSGKIFGEAILFSNKDAYPISVNAITDCEILFLSKSDIMRVINKHPQFLENYLLLLSTKLLFFNDKFKLLSLSSIRGKIAHVLIKLSKEQNSKHIKLPFSKEKMALHICTRRPSLSRELSKMKKEGLINYEKNTVDILDYDGLVDELF